MTNSQGILVSSTGSDFRRWMAAAYCAINRALYLLLLILCTIAGGCAQDAPVPVQPVTIVARDFCELVDKPRDLTWSVNDTKDTITSLRRLGAKWDSRCARR